jgi:hypothetical protein
MEAIIMNKIPLIFAYLSPETYLPVTSILATFFGVVLMFGRGTLSLAMRWLRRLGRSRVRTTSQLKGPHFRVPSRHDSRGPSAAGSPLVERTPLNHGVVLGDRTHE